MNLKKKFISVCNCLCMFSYMIEEGICYLTLTDKTYPKRLAFLFLEDIAKEFVQDLKAEHGEKYVQTIWLLIHIIVMDNFSFQVAKCS